MNFVEEYAGEGLGEVLEWTLDSSIFATTYTVGQLQFDSLADIAGIFFKRAGPPHEDLNLANSSVRVASLQAQSFLVPLMDCRGNLFCCNIFKAICRIIAIT